MMKWPANVNTMDKNVWFILWRYMIWSRSKQKKRLNKRHNWQICLFTRQRWAKPFFKPFISRQYLDLKVKTENKTWTKQALRTDKDTDRCTFFTKMVRGKKRKKKWTSLFCIVFWGSRNRKRTSVKQPLASNKLGAPFFFFFFLARKWWGYFVALFGSRKDRNRKQTFSNQQTVRQSCLNFDTKTMGVNKQNKCIGLF